ncbi:MAG: hypothetical protein ACRDXB_07850, partial [Actinomycetes bacterium]
MRALLKSRLARRAAVLLAATAAAWVMLAVVLALPAYGAVLAGAVESGIGSWVAAGWLGLSGAVAVLGWSVPLVLALGFGAAGLVAGVAELGWMAFRARGPPPAGVTLTGGMALAVVLGPVVAVPVVPAAAGVLLGAVAMRALQRPAAFADRGTGAATGMGSTAAVVVIGIAAAIGMLLWGHDAGAVAAASFGLPLSQYGRPEDPRIGRLRQLLAEAGRELDVAELARLIPELTADFWRRLEDHEQLHREGPWAGESHKFDLDGLVRELDRIRERRDWDSANLPQDWAGQGSWPVLDELIPRTADEAEERAAEIRAAVHRLLSS